MRNSGPASRLKDIVRLLIAACALTSANLSFGDEQKPDDSDKGSPSAAKAHGEIAAYFPGASAPAEAPAADPLVGKGAVALPGSESEYDSGSPSPDAELYDRISERLAVSAFGSILFGILLRKIFLTLTFVGLSPAGHDRRMWALSFLVTPLAFVSFCTYGFAIGWGNSFNGPVAPGWYASLGPGMSLLNRGFGLGADAQYEGVFRYGLMGAKGFFMLGTDDVAVVSLLGFMLGFFDIGATIPVGAIGPAWRVKNLCMYVLWAALPYSLFANWVWGGGWLTQAGVNWGLGHGAVDFAGSGVVYAMGGMMALAACIVVRGREVAVASSPHSRYRIAIALAASLLPLFEPIFAELNEPQSPSILAAILLAAGAGGSAAVVVELLAREKASALRFAQGVLAGVAAISASCPFVHYEGAGIIGAVAGGLCVSSIRWLKSRKIHDLTGAISIYGVGGLWGTLAVGLFATGEYGAGWGGVARDDYVVKYGQDCVRGLLYGDPSQLGAQALSVIAEVPVGFGLAWLLFKLTDRITPIYEPRATNIPAAAVAEAGA